MGGISSLGPKGNNSVWRVPEKPAPNSHRLRSSMLDKRLKQPLQCCRSKLLLISFTYLNRAFVLRRRNSFSSVFRLPLYLCKKLLFLVELQCRLCMPRSVHLLFNCSSNTMYVATKESKLTPKRLYLHICKGLCFLWYDYVLFDNLFTYLQI